MRSRSEIKANAREALKEQRITAILVNIVYFIPYLILIFFITPMIGRATSIWVELLADYIIMFVVLVVYVGLCYVYMKIYKNEQAEVGEMVHGFYNFGRNFIAGVLFTVLLILWTLLLIIPGIIKALSYSWVFFILADSESIGARKSIQASMKITKGHKINICLFHCSFLGWYLLGLLTFGILWIVYVIPYHYTSAAGYYMEMRTEALISGRITAEDLN